MHLTNAFWFVVSVVLDLVRQRPFLPAGTFSFGPNTRRVKVYRRPGNAERLRCVQEVYPYITVEPLHSDVSYAQAQDEKQQMYRNAQVWRTTLRGPGDIILIKKLLDQQDISIWKLVPSSTDFLVPAENVVKVKQNLSSRNMTFIVTIPNVQRSIDDQKTSPALWDEHTLRIGHRMNWKSFPPLNIIEEYLNFLAEEYSSICKLQDIGYTSENRAIKMINITNGNPKNKIVLITSGVHGREWVSITSVLYVLNTIVTQFDQQPDHIKNKNWLIIPVVNPDGYHFTHTHDRLWRKNCRKFLSCKGADINRNFELDWGITGIIETGECKDAYAGPYPFSEVESVAIANVVSNTKKRVNALIDVHSYGHLILYPWCARSQKSPDLDLHKLTAEEMAKAIMAESGIKYNHGPTYHRIYPATGTMLDWIYYQGAKHSYAIETRDNGQFGFLLPPHEIEDTGKEIFAAVNSLASTLDPKILQRAEDTEAWF